MVQATTVAEIRILNLISAAKEQTSCGSCDRFVITFANAVLGDLFGFAAIILTAVSAIFMFFRGKIVRRIKNLSLIRTIHIVISALAGLFLVLHVAYYITYPVNVGIYVGYVAFGTSLVVWLTGTGFLEKVKDSLLFHGSLSIGFVSLVLIHAASSGVNIPFVVSVPMILATIGILVANIGYHTSKMR
jgi:hypothetical protein